jgi:hypothetical protein
MGGEEGGAVNGEGESGIRGINIWEEGEGGDNYSL